MSKGSNRRPGKDDIYASNHERIFGKRGFRDFQKGRRIHLGDERGRKHDNENFESWAMSCDPSQVADHNKRLGHLATWRKDGTCFIHNCKTQRELFKIEGKFLKNDTAGGKGSAKKYLEKTGQLTEVDVERERRTVPKPMPRKGEMSMDDAEKIIGRFKAGKKLTG